MMREWRWAAWIVDSPLQVLLHYVRGFSAPDAGSTTHDDERLWICGHGTKNSEEEAMKRRNPNGIDPGASAVTVNGRNGSRTNGRRVETGRKGSLMTGAPVAVAAHKTQGQPIRWNGGRRGARPAGAVGMQISKVNMRGRIGTHSENGCRWEHG
jgi:hypothetical protein